MNPYVTLVALDFAKAYDTMRLFVVVEIIVLLFVPDAAHNWFVDYVL